MPFFPRRNRYVNRDELERAVARIMEVIHRMGTSEQQQIDAITQQLEGVQTNLDTARATLQQEIDQLAGGQPANLDNLRTVAAALSTSSGSIGSLTPTPPTPTP